MRLWRPRFARCQQPCSPLLGGRPAGAPVIPMEGNDNRNGGAAHFPNWHRPVSVNAGVTAVARDEKAASAGISLEAAMASITTEPAPSLLTNRLMSLMLLKSITPSASLPVNQLG